MGIGQSYDSREKELIEQEITKGFECVEEASCALCDAINNLDGKNIRTLEKLEEAQRLINEFELANEESDYDEAERVGYHRTPYGWM